MFFRRRFPKQPAFQKRIENLRSLGFDVDTLDNGRVRATKHGVAAIIEDAGPRNPPKIEEAGLLAGNEIATLLSGGYQMFLATPSGKKFPAQAEQLRALHQFEDDAKEVLGVANLYNTSLGTTSQKHAYDRVAGYSHPTRRPWEKRAKWGSRAD